MLRKWLDLSLVSLVACVSTPPAPSPGTGTLYGTLQLIPRAEVPVVHDDAGYADPRLRHARLVDYARPGFAVVFIDGRSVESGNVTLTLGASERGPALHPHHAVVGVGGTLTLVNATDAAQAVSLPALGVIATLGPEEQRELEAAAPGPVDVFCLNGDCQADVFVAAGPWAIVESDGGWELRDLEPGPVDLRTWHPRFPSARRAVVVRPDAATRIDLHVGVGLSPETPDAD